MRNKPLGSWILHYPDELIFAFDVCPLWVENADTEAVIKYFDVTVECGSVSHTLSAYGHDGQAQIDIQTILQWLFADAAFDKKNRTWVSDTMKAVDITATITDDEGKTYSLPFSVNVVWGTQRTAEETYPNAGRKIKAFAGYPFAVSVYTEDKNGVLIETPTTQTEVAVTTSAIYDIPLTLQAGTTLVGFYSGASVFDNTFDKTFAAGRNFTEILAEIECVEAADEGTYLRWIDRHGFVCYWLFKNGDTQTKVTATAHRYNDLAQYDTPHGYKNTAGTRQSFTAEVVQPICAPLVDRDTWQMLADMTTSPIVAAYINGGWVNVNIQGATYTYDHKMPLQDFTCNMVYPELNTQTL